MLAQTPVQASEPGSGADTLIYVEAHFERGESWRLDCTLPNGAGPDFSIFEYDRSREEWSDESGSGWQESEGMARGYNFGRLEVWGQLAGQRVGIEDLEGRRPGYPNPLSFWIAGTAQGVQTMVMAIATWDAHMTCSMTSDGAGDIALQTLDPARARQFALADFSGIASAYTPAAQMAVGASLSRDQVGTGIASFSFDNIARVPSSLLTITLPDGSARTRSGSFNLSRVAGTGRWGYHVSGLADLLVNNPLWTMELPPSPFPADPPWQS